MSNLKSTPYRIGIDVGTNSVGLAAVAVDTFGTPSKILAATSVIHDSGVSKDKRKTAETLLAVGGVARRTRRLYRTRKRRLKNLDSWLLKNGYPIVANEEFENPLEPWISRKELLEQYISDDADRKEMISTVLRHMARHRGWRSPFIKVESLFEPAEPSDFLKRFQADVTEKTGRVVPESFSVTETLFVALQHFGSDPTKLKFRGDSSKQDDVVVVPMLKLAQSDFANELQRIAEKQKISQEELKHWVRLVFFTKSPKGASIALVGHDPLPGQTHLLRAPRASIFFQNFRILAALANVRVKEHGQTRPLDPEEREAAFLFLSEGFASDKSRDVSWRDVADLLGLERNQLVGLATLDVDNESFSRRPPTNITNKQIQSFKVKKVRSWWADADDYAKESLINYLIGNEISDEVAELYESLDEAEQLALDELHLTPGRAAYSADTLERLSKRMVSDGVDLHAARKMEFNIGDDWTPPVPEIWEPVGNPAVDRVLKIVNRFLLACERKWGMPVSINIEHVRDGFISEAESRKLTREMDTRGSRREELFKATQARLGVNNFKRSDLRRFMAIERQNGCCAYCGSAITLKTAELDHIIPRKNGASDSKLANLVATCQRCNKSKTNQVFSVWAENCGIPGVSVDAAVERVKFWTQDPKHLPTPVFKRLKADVISRLKRTDFDPEPDGRSMESVAWMARELRSRVKAKYADSRVGVFRGEITAEARKSSGFENRIHMIVGTGKQRLDRRHHAVDALVIAMMRPSVAATLAMRSQLRRSQNDLPLHRLTEDVSWKKFYGNAEGDRKIFFEWSDNMAALAELTDTALAADRITVQRSLRLKLNNGQAHDATIKGLIRKRVGDELSLDLIERASTPALWCALTRHPDFDPNFGLPENVHREISLQGRNLNSGDEISFFKSAGAQIKVGEGSADIGSTIHHARIYVFPSGKQQKPTYAMVRVFASDLLRHQREDLFSVSLPPQSISVRQAPPKLREALMTGTAKLLGVLVVGDVIVLPENYQAEGDVKQLLDMFPNVNRWVVEGFPDPGKFRLRPAYLAGEGLTAERSNPGVEKILNGQGWRVAVGKIIPSMRIVERVNILGIPLETPSNGYLTSWAVEAQ